MINTTTAMKYIYNTMMAQKPNNILNLHHRERPAKAFMNESYSGLITKVD